MVSLGRRCAIVSAVLFLGGCSARTGPLFGKVTYQGKAVVYGTVMAMGADGITRSTNIQPDGSYRFEVLLPIGAVKLAVISPEPLNPGANRRVGERGPPKTAANDSETLLRQWFKIPEQYADIRTSGLATTVSRQGQDFEIALK